MTNSNMRKAGVLFIIYATIISCSSREANGPKLYAIDSLLSAQAKYLSENSATLKKATMLGDRQDEVIVTPQDAASWKKELEIFAALDVINKPLNRDLYSLASVADKKSNLIVKSITTAADLPVKYLRVYYQRAPNKIRKIEAAYKQSNALYESDRALTMEFQQVGNGPALTSYTIVGAQKMFMGDSVRYTISGSLTLSK